MNEKADHEIGLFIGCSVVVIGLPAGAPSAAKNLAATWELRDRSHAERHGLHAHAERGNDQNL
ncbi:hypothetical protein PSEUDO8O_30326 [Pseudomonas sp. 8O]|nr:hypothetical protein PSEUDO8O_30326 [Pseudomonas sp. 8O]